MNVIILICTVDNSLQTVRNLVIFCYMMTAVPFIGKQSRLFEKYHIDICHSFLFLQPQCNIVHYTSMQSTTRAHAILRCLGAYMSLSQIITFSCKYVQNTAWLSIFGQKHEQVHYIINNKLNLDGYFIV